MEKMDLCLFSLWDLDFLSTEIQTKKFKKPYVRLITQPATVEQKDLCSNVEFNTTAGTHEIMPPLCYGRAFFFFFLQIHVSATALHLYAMFFFCDLGRHSAITLTSGLTLKITQVSPGDTCL